MHSLFEADLMLAQVQLRFYLDPTQIPSVALLHL
jgi:hypothetical protein